MPAITLASDADAIEFYSTPDVNGWVYDNATMSSWLRLAEVDVKLNKRPNAHGTYLPDQLFTVEHRTEFAGQFYGETALAATVARNRLAALFNDGRAVVMTVTDDLGATGRVGFVIAYDPEWMPDGHFAFAFAFAAPDPRRYAPSVEEATGLPSPSSGLLWPLGTTPGLFWDWGTPGDPGRVTLTNHGNTTTFPVAYVGAGGTLSGGFRLTEVETGRELEFPVSTGGGVVRLDSRTQRATINGGDVTGDMTRKEWFSIPPQATRSYQFAALGGVTGAPLFQLFGADAYL